MSNKIYSHLAWGIPLADYSPELEEAAEDVGLDIITHNIDNEISYHILAISESSYQASSRAKPTALRVALETKPEWRETLEIFCRRKKLPFEEPLWHLATSWDR